LRRAGLALVVILVVIAVAAAALYLNRRAAARQALVGWLDQRGVQADVEVERIELNGFVGRVRIGDPADPDVTVERVEVDYAVGLPWSRTGLGVTPSRIRLVRPVLRASWRDGRLSLGSLDPLIEEFTGRPPRPDSRAPLVIVEGGRARVDTEYGQVLARGDARLDNGKLMRLTGGVSAPTLKSGDIEARDLGARLDLTTTGDRVALSLSATAAAFDTPALAGQAARLTLTGALPYPDLKARRGDGLALIDARLTAERLGQPALQARDADVALRFDGRTSGWIEAFRIEGAQTLSLTAAAIEGADLKAADVAARSEDGRLVLTRGEDFRWSAQAPLTLTAASLRAGAVETRGATIRTADLALGGRDGAFEATGQAEAAFERLGFADLVLKQAQGRASLDLVHDGATRIDLAGALRSADGAWPLFGPVAGDDLPDVAEMKRALGAFAFEAPAFRFSTGTAGTSVVLARPATLRPRNGGVLTVTQAGEGVYQAEPGRLGGGALTLTASRGRGLPELDVAVPEWRLTETGFEARLDGRARLDFDLARGVDATTAGLLALADGRLTYAPQDCVDLTVERLELDENDVHQVAGRLCPQDGPLFASRDGAWRVIGGFDEVQAQAPFLGMRFADASGRVTVDGGQAGVSLIAGVTDARVIDATNPRRFHPLAATGQARLAGERWTGAFDLTGAGAALGRLMLNHDGRTGAGGLTIKTPQIVFAEPGLQPSDLTPLLDDFVQSPVTGSAGFEGRVDWTKDAEPTSSGRLTIPGLDFTSPAGPVEGLKGDIVLTSLTPLVTAPDQRLTIDRLDTATDATGLDLTFALDATALNVAGARVAAAGGFVSIEPFAIPLDPTQPFSGVVVLDRVQLGQVVSDSGFGDKVQLDALVSGRLPFTSDPRTGFKVTGGSLVAVEPGRLSIKREVLAEVDAGGGGDVPPSMVEDLAYQAMENLAFDVLTAEVNSRDDDRMAVLFHIRGRHDPPQKQELRLTLGDLISRRFLNRNLPLPSNTGIDLTLDTTLNLNQLIGDLLAVNRARQGEAEKATQP
jgi:hypothetical protein